MNTATYGGYYNWINIATIFMNVIIDKQVLK